MTYFLCARPSTFVIRLAQVTSHSSARVLSLFTRRQIYSLKIPQDTSISTRHLKNTVEDLYSRGYALRAGPFINQAYPFKLSDSYPSLGGHIFYIGTAFKATFSALDITMHGLACIVPILKDLLLFSLVRWLTADDFDNKFRSPFSDLCFEFFAGSGKFFNSRLFSFQH